MAYVSTDPNWGLEEATKDYVSTDPDWGLGEVNGEPTPQQHAPALLDWDELSKQTGFDANPQFQDLPSSEQSYGGLGGTDAQQFRPSGLSEPILRALPVTDRARVALPPQTPSPEFAPEPYESAYTTPSWEKISSQVVSSHGGFGRPDAGMIADAPIVPRKPGETSATSFAASMQDPLWHIAPIPISENDNERVKLEKTIGNVGRSFISGATSVYGALGLLNPYIALGQIVASSPQIIERLKHAEQTPPWSVERHEAAAEVLAVILPFALHAGSGEGAKARAAERADVHSRIEEELGFRRGPVAPETPTVGEPVPAGAQLVEPSTVADTLLQDQLDPRLDPSIVVDERQPGPDKDLPQMRERGSIGSGGLTKKKIGVPKTLAEFNEWKAREAERKPWEFKAKEPTNKVAAATEPFKPKASVPVTQAELAAFNRRLTPKQKLEQKAREFKGEPEPSVPAEIQTPQVEPEPEVKAHGVSRAARDKAGTVEVTTGSHHTAEEHAEMGDKLISEGADPVEVVRNARQQQAWSANAVNIAIAHDFKLTQIAEDARAKADAFPGDARLEETATRAEKSAQDWEDRAIRPIREKFHETGMALQQARSLSLPRGSYVDYAKQFIAENKRKPTAAEEVKLKAAAKKVRDINAAEAKDLKAREAAMNKRLKPRKIMDLDTLKKSLTELKEKLMKDCII